MERDMKLPSTETLHLREDGFVLHVTLNRPEARNAMSLQMTQELRAVFSAIAGSDAIRAVLLRAPAATSVPAATSRTWPVPACRPCRAATTKPMPI